MINITPSGFGIPLSIPGEHGLVHGQLDLLPGGGGLVVLAHAATALNARENILAGIFRHCGLSTLSIDLLSRQEERFADAHNNIPLLAKRLLEFLGLLKNRMLLGELERQPIGLYAAHATSPVAVRVAALRDHDIAAIVCRGGLIDLAGMLYLRSLESPLLLLIEESDEQHIASSRRALQEVHCPRELKLIPEVGIDFAISSGFKVAANEAAQWFLRHFKLASHPSPA
jgi:putative phosphoribosyl transferase